LLKPPQKPSGNGTRAAGQWGTMRMWFSNRVKVFLGQANVCDLPYSTNISPEESSVSQHSKSSFAS